MSEYQSSLLKLLGERGYIHQMTDAAALDALASKEVVSAYIGFDATAPSLHVGNLVSIMLLRRLQQAGHKPVVVMGGGTTRIGDPTGKDEVRKMLTDAAIEANMADDFRQIDGSGNVETRRSFVDDIVSPDLRIDPYTVEDFDVRLYGDVALLSGRTRMTGAYKGKPFASHYRYIDIYVHRNGAWKIVSVQISRIPD